MDARYAREQRYRKISNHNLVDELLGNSKDEDFPSSNEAPQAKNTKYLFKNRQNVVFESHFGRNILRNAKDEEFSCPKMSWAKILRPRALFRAPKPSSQPRRHG